MTDWNQKLEHHINNETRQIIIASLILLPVILALLAVWNIDIAFSAAISNGLTIGGFGTREPVTHYHLSLVVLLVSLSGLGLLNVFFILKNEKKKWKREY